MSEIVSDFLAEIRESGLAVATAPELCHHKEGKKLCLLPVKTTGDNTYGIGEVCPKGHMAYNRSTIPCDGCCLLVPHDKVASIKKR